MSRIAIDAIKPGMIAASDIQSPDGRIILPAGQKMEPWHLKLLAGLGLEAIEIEDPAAVADPGEPGEEQGIHGKPVPLRLLENPEPAPAQGVRRFTGFDIHTQPEALSRQDRRTVPGGCPSPPAGFPVSPLSPFSGPRPSPASLDIHRGCLFRA